MSKKPVFADLKEAIKEALLTAHPVRYNVLGDAVGYEIDTSELKLLQAEYNIHFVESEDEQLKVV